MKLFEMKTLPKEFGKATIDYVKGRAVPSREGNTIVIPDGPSTALYPLQHMGKRDQFILEVGDRYWFGGTDESPFLVELSEHPVSAFLEGGVLREANFYCCLRYQEVDRLSHTVRRVWKRQGDIFAVPLRLGWSSLQHCFGVAAKELEVTEVEGLNVFDTRHLLVGRQVAYQLTDKYVPSVSVFGVHVRLIASGVVSAPDHSDMVLGDRPHALFQTAGLRDPLNAD